MLPCRRCKAFGSKVDFSDFTSQQLRDHVEIHRRQSLACFGAEVHFEDCFSSTAAKTPAASSELASRRQHDSCILKELGAIIKRYDCNGRVRCKICQISMSYKQHTNAISHAMGHLRRDLFQCRICSKAFSNIVSVRAHINSQHKISVCNNYVDKCEEYRKELIRIAKECFKPRAKEIRNLSTQATSIGSAKDCMKPRVEDSRSSAGADQVTSYESAKPLLVKIIKSNQKSGFIKCNECKSLLQAHPGSARRVCESAINHPMVHFDQWLFTCTFCNRQGKTCASMRQHTNRKHNSIKFKSIWGNRWSKLVEFTQKCYGSRRVKQIKEPKRDRFPPEVGKRRRTCFMAIFMRKLLSDDKSATNIRCNLCSRWIGIKTSAGYTDSYRARIHALKCHLRLPLYKCLTCGAMRTNSRDMNNHKQIHRGKKFDGSTRTYVDFTLQNKEKILEALEECYGTKTIKKECSAGAKLDKERATVKSEKPSDAGSSMDKDGTPSGICSMKKRYTCNVCAFSTSFCTLLTKHASVMHPPENSAQ